MEGPSEVVPSAKAAAEAAGAKARQDIWKADAVATMDPASGMIDKEVKETHHISIVHNPVSGRKNLNKYEIIKKLGSGQHGQVKLGWDPEARMYVAIKTVDRREPRRLGRSLRGPSTEEKVRREIAILKKCSHPNVVKLIEVLDDMRSRKIYLILEYCSQGEVKWQNVDGTPALDIDQARDIARDILLGLEYLHEHDIIHRDIKPANLLISDEGRVKISDFGVSYARTKESPNDYELAKTVGTPAFFAPEMCMPADDKTWKRPQLSSKIDMWAFGITLFGLIYGYLPFDADNEYELFHKIASNEPVRIPPSEDRNLQLANDLLAKLLDKDQNTRLSASQAKEHPWLAQGISDEEHARYVNSNLGEHIEVSNEDVDHAVKGIGRRLKEGLNRIADVVRPGVSQRRKLSRGKSGSTIASPPMNPTVAKTAHSSVPLSHNYSNSTLSSLSLESEVYIPAIANSNSQYGESSASSSSSSENGELTLDLGRSRSNGLSFSNDRLAYREGNSYDEFA